MPDPSTGGKESGTETLRASCPKSDLYKSFSLILKDRTYVFGDIFLCLLVKSERYPEKDDGCFCS